jgi:hypothetical protein
MVIFYNSQMCDVITYNYFGIVKVTEKEDQWSSYSKF